MMYDDVVTVVENRPLTGGHYLLSVHSPRQARATRPGQFAMVRLPGGLDTLLRRPMSIYDVKPGNERRIEIAGHRPALQRRALQQRQSLSSEEHTSELQSHAP